MVEPPFSEIEIGRYIAARLPMAKMKKKGEWWLFPCPLHSGKDSNFAVHSHTGQWRCHSRCKAGGDIFTLEQRLNGGDFPAVKGRVFETMGRSGELIRTPPLTPPPKAVSSFNGWREVARYEYTDEAGQLLYYVVRRENGTAKKFVQCRPDGNGGLIWNLDGVESVPYRLAQMLKAETVYICEGEKDCGTLNAWGLTATTNSGGANKSDVYGKWAERWFKGKHVVCLPDNDGPGRKHIAAVAVALLPLGASVRVVELPGLLEKGDVTDWKAAGGTKDEFLKLVEATPPLDGPALDSLRTKWGLVERSTPQASTRVEVSIKWPKLQPLEPALQPVDPFQEDLLPGVFKPMVLDLAERMGVPVDFPAVALLICAGGCVNRRAFVRPKQYDTSWRLPLNFWGLLIARPSKKKSPVVSRALRPIEAIQNRWRDEAAADRARYEKEKRKYDIVLKAWNQRETNNIKGMLDTPDQLKSFDDVGNCPIEPPEEPKQKRITVNDTTVEALHREMSEHPSGVLVHYDEFAGLVNGFDRQGHENERAFYLSAWDGTQSFEMTRIGRGNVRAVPCLSLIATAQPTVMQRLSLDAIKEADGKADGFLQRVQLAIWPDFPNGYQHVDIPPADHLEAQVAAVFERLAAMDHENPSLLRFSPDAQKLYVEWDISSMAMADDLDIHPALSSHFAKYAGLMPKLAALFHLIEGGEGDEISLQRARQAAGFCDYLASHARRIYGCVANSDQYLAAEIAEKIKRKKLGDEQGTFTVRDVYRAKSGEAQKPEPTKRALEVLEDAGWVRAIEREPGTRGRTSDRYEINPEVCA